LDARLDSRQPRRPDRLKTKRSVETSAKTTRPRSNRPGARPIRRALANRAITQ